MNEKEKLTPEEVVIPPSAEMQSEPVASVKERKPLSKKAKILLISASSFLLVGLIVLVRFIRSVLKVDKEREGNTKHDNTAETVYLLEALNKYRF